MSSSDNNKDLRRERFVRIIEKRVSRILYDLDNLGKCSNKKNYQYTDKDIRKIFNAINKKVKEKRDLFADTSKPRSKFKLEV